MIKKMAVLMPNGDVRDTFVPKASVNRINNTFQTEWNTLTRHYTPEETAEAIRNCDYCLTGWGCPAFTADVIKNAENLKLVAHTGGSVATLVSDSLYDRGIIVMSGNDIYARSVAEGAVAYMLAGLRKIPFYANSVQQGGWNDMSCYHEGLLDQKVGLLGFGAIARYTAKYLSAFDCRVFAYDPYVSEEVFAEYGVIRAKTPEELITDVKILSLHMPRTKETFHFLNRERLKMLPDGTLLVNTARGSIIDEEAFIDELLTRRISAVLDVFHEEPLPADSRLRNLDNVILLPHMAGPTKDRFPLVTEGLLDDIVRYEKGEPLKLVISREYAAGMTRDDKLDD